jgi:hypothetical protein
MYEWFKILDTSRLTGEAATNDYDISNWRDLVIRFIVDVKIQPDTIVGVDLYSLFCELLKAGFVIPTGQPFHVNIGEGWEMTGHPIGNQMELKIGFFILTENREPVVIKTLSSHETMLFIATKISELVSSLERLGVSLESYLKNFPPEAYSRKYAS